MPASYIVPIALIGFVIGAALLIFSPEDSTLALVGEIVVCTCVAALVASLLALLLYEMVSPA